MRGEIAVVPFSGAYLDDRLFAVGGPLDRDGALAPFALLRQTLEAEGFAVHTIDRIEGPPAAVLHLDAHRPVDSRADPARTVVVLLEPLVTAPYWYDRVRSGEVDVALIYMLSSELVDGDRVRMIAYPQAVEVAPHGGPRRFDLVMINARKFPVRKAGELYSTRENVAAQLAKRRRIEVFGPGWGSRSLRHPISWQRNVRIRNAHRGTVESKLEVLRQARFCLCFENSRHPGYLTEKLFDAMAAGAVPIYLGDPTIRDRVGAGFIDYEELGSARAVQEFVENVSPQEEGRLRAAGWEWLRSEGFRPFRAETFCETVTQALMELAKAPD